MSVVNKAYVQNFVFVFFCVRISLLTILDAADVHQHKKEYPKLHRHGWKITLHEKKKEINILYNSQAFVETCTTGVR